MKLKIWLDSGANFQSRREITVGLEEVGLAEEEWLKMTESQKEEFVKDIAFEQAEWGWEEIN